MKYCILLPGDTWKHSSRDYEFPNILGFKFLYIFIFVINLTVFTQILFFVKIVFFKLNVATALWGHNVVSLVESDYKVLHLSSCLAIDAQ